MIFDYVSGINHKNDYKELDVNGKHKFSWKTLETDEPVYITKKDITKIDNRIKNIKNIKIIKFVSYKYCDIEYYINELYYEVEYMNDIYLSSIYLPLNIERILKLERILK